MRYIVDPALCAAHGRCYVIAPDVFEADEEGYNARAGDTVDVPVDLESAARDGAASCPESAIFVIED